MAKKKTAKAKEKTLKVVVNGKLQNITKAEVLKLSKQGKQK